VVAPRTGIGAEWLVFISVILSPRLTFPDIVLAMAELRTLRERPLLASPPEFTLIDNGTLKTGCFLSRLPELLSGLSALSAFDDKTFNALEAYFKAMITKFTNLNACSFKSPFRRMVRNSATALGNVSVCPSDFHSLWLVLAAPPALAILAPGAFFADAAGGRSAVARAGLARGKMHFG
jgi:hypothetical protein